MIALVLLGWARGTEGFSYHDPKHIPTSALDYLLERFQSAADRGHIERHHSWFGSLGPDGLREVLAPQLGETLASDDLFASAYARVAGRQFPDALAELLFTDFTMYLQDGLLTKVDRAAMLTSLEVRAPYLDHELAEFAADVGARLRCSGIDPRGRAWSLDPSTTRTSDLQDAIAAAMRRIVGEPVLRERLIERGFANALRFSWVACARAVMTAVERSVAALAEAQEEKASLPGS